MGYPVMIEPFSERHLQPMMTLLRAYFPPGDRLLTISYTRWLYESNPFGRARIAYVGEEREWQAFMALIPIALARRDEQLNAFYVVNVLVHPEHQGKFLFGKLISAAKAHAAGEKAALLGHPNHLALKSWERARMHFLAPLRPTIARPALLPREVRARVSNSYHDLATVETKLEELRRAESKWKVAAGTQYLRWRYLDHPTNRYTVQIVECQGSPVGVQVSKRLRAGVHLLLDQFVPHNRIASATRCLPPFTICFTPDAYVNDLKGALYRLPLRKRIPFFATHEPRLDEDALSRLNLSPTDL